MPAPKPTPPTPLWQVLEQEYIALGGALSDTYRNQRTAALAAIPTELVDDRLTRENQAVLPLLYTQFHQRAAADPAHKRTALCFSGGGIRSATFNLGILQRLVELDLLHEFDYLSTVSGGGYLGSWLSAWIHHDPTGVRGVIRHLNAAAPNTTPDRCQGPGLNQESSTQEPPPKATNPEPSPLRHLRKFSRYLSPTLGVFSPDTWTLATIYLRNLLLNWLVLIPILVALLMIPRLCIAVVALDPAYRDVPWFGLSSRAQMRILLTLGMLLAAWAFAYTGLYQPSARRARLERSRATHDRPNPRRGSDGQLHFLKWCWTPLMLSALCLSAFWTWWGADDPLRFKSWYFVGFGICLGVVGWAVFAASERQLAKLKELPAVIVAGAVFGLCLFGAVHLMYAIVWYRPDPNILDPRAGDFYARYVCLGLPLIVLSFSIGGTVYVGFVSRLRSTYDEDREWWARAGAWLLMALVGWLLVAGVVLYGPGLILYGGQRLSVALASAGGITGLITLWFGRSATSPATPTPRADKSWTQIAMGVVTALAAPVAITVLITALSLGTGILLFMTWKSIADPGTLDALFPVLSGQPNRFWISGHPAQSYFRMLYVPAPLFVLGWMAALALFGLLMSRLIDLNKFSMHGMYRDRIVRAYLGASRADCRRPDPFTGFDPDDHLYVHHLRPEVVRKEDLIGDDFLKRLAAAAQKKSDTTSDPVSAYLVGQMQRTTRDALAAFAARPDRARTAVLDDLAALIIESDFAKSPAFPAEFSGNVSSLLANSTRPQHDTPLRNRLLLDAAYPNALRPLAVDRAKSVKPLHVINIALNLVNTDDPTWQERKAESFTVSPMHSGSGRLGYRNSLRYGGDHGIGLGTAVTISGAAVSPNMGYHSSKPVAFLMTLFNVRLGWWLGNPGVHGNDTFRRAYPVFSVTPLVAEALGLSDDRHRYVYLSDGGHFENLGLYEMVRRRCHTIVLGDAGRDPKCTFEDLGNAVRKVRIDLGVPITFLGSIALRARDAADAATAGRYCAVGVIHYKAIDGSDAVDGLLLYIKPAFYGHEPADVFNYAKGCEDFPHESTADQFFSESQFESYRALGYHTLQQIWGSPDPAGELDGLVRRACQYLGLKADAICAGAARVDAAQQQQQQTAAQAASLV